jgi:N-acetylmuramoyl-L-alanine amidase
MKLTLCIDPGHGMSNRRAGVYDPGATVRVGNTEITEAGIVMDWANELKIQLEMLGAKVIRTRINSSDVAPVGERASIAHQYGCAALISLHCNAANGKASGTETFYRNASNAKLAQACNDAVRLALGTKDRGIKTEAASQHSRLAVLNFPAACLIELGFIDHEGDRARMMDQQLMLLACQNLALSLVTEYQRPPKL